MQSLHHYISRVDACDQVRTNYGDRISLEIEKDNSRLGVDDILGRFSPIVKHGKYEVKFRPVVNGGLNLK